MQNRVMSGAVWVYAVLSSAFAGAAKWYDALLSAIANATGWYAVVQGLLIMALLVASLPALYQLMNKMGG